MVWEIRQHVEPYMDLKKYAQPGGREERAKRRASDFQHLLEEWEPFSVTVDSHNNIMYYFRRQV